MATVKNRHRADIVAAIHKRGTSLAELARKNRLSDAALRISLSAPRKPSNLIIAAFLGEALHDIWPRWFTPAGDLIAPNRRPVRRRPSSQKSHPKLTLHGAVRP